MKLKISMILKHLDDEQDDDVDEVLEILIDTKNFSRRVILRQGVRCFGGV